MKRNVTTKKDGVSDNFLTYIPIPNPKYPFEVNEKQEVTILQEHRGPFYFLTQKLMKKPRYTQIHLDEMGNYIWPLMDGKNDIIAIASAVKEHYGQKAEPLYPRMAQYFQTLASYAFVILNKPE